MNSDRMSNKDILKTVNDNMYLVKPRSQSITLRNLKSGPAYE